MSSLTDRERAIRLRLRDDFRHYARKCLVIRTKSGSTADLSLNAAQAYLHARLEAQKAKTGRVRALVLKGRQQGVSTYVSGRFYHRATHSRGQRVFILSHEQEATESLFGIVNRFHDNIPTLVKPSTGSASAKTLSFDKLGSDYKVATAGTKAVGRSQTIQLFHGSEVAFWPHAETHSGGALQAVPDVPGTEVILESTANGMGNYFHGAWQDAEAGVSDYEAIFIPWFWQDEYRRVVPEGFRPTAEETDYAEQNGLDMEQIAWRRAKIAELKDEDLFRQEYPANAHEAFQMSGEDSFIRPALVAKARARTLEPMGPLILGVDPKRFGKDRFSIAWRRGRKVLKVRSTARNMDAPAAAGYVAEFIRADKPARVFIDVGGQGSGVGDILKSWFGPEIIRLVDFGGGPFTQPIDDEEGKGGGPKNRRAEMWMGSRDWLEDPGGADIPDLDSLQADACGPRYTYDTHGRLVMESKEHMMTVRKLRSPDEWDAVALTFAEPVAPTAEFRVFGNAAADSHIGY